jgi:hypothetical protein
MAYVPPFEMGELQMVKAIHTSPEIRLTPKNCNGTSETDLISKKWALSGYNSRNLQKMWPFSKMDKRKGKKQTLFRDQKNCVLKSVYFGYKLFFRDPN